MRRVVVTWALVVCACGSPTPVKQATTGPPVSLCLGPNRSMVLEPERAEKLRLVIDGSTEIGWSGGEPRVVGSLVVGKQHTIAIKWDGDVIESYKIDPRSSKMLTVYKSSGLWHLVHNAEANCAFPFEGVEVGSSESKCFASIGATTPPCGSDSF